MNARTLAELALKIWGVMLFVGALLSLPGALWMLGTLHDSDPQSAFARTSQYAYIVNIILQALSGVAVAVWADRIAAWFESDTAPLQIGVSTGELQVIGFALVGVFFLVDGLGNAAAAGYALLTKPPFDRTEVLPYLWERQGEAMVRAVIQLGAGALLVFGREAVVRGWSRLRGQIPSDADDDTVV